MQYGYFDSERREYVITDPHTPSPWANYLGSPEYGAIISNNAGGYSFVKSGANGRILRYCFNSFDTPGRYIYLRDNLSGEYRCLTRFPDICRHGTGYTVMNTSFRDTETEISYYVPNGAAHEVWYVKLKNSGRNTISAVLTGYAEFTCNSNYEQDTVNLQYSQFITRTEFRDNRIRQLVHANLDGCGSTTEHCPEERIFAFCGESVSSYCGDRALFLGDYRDYFSPEGVEKGNLGNVLNYGENPCGALSAEVKLAPGEEKCFAFILSACGNAAAEALCRHYTEPGEVCRKEIEELRKSFNGKLEKFKVNTPSSEFNEMVNTWNAYNCFITFTWSRAASFIYCGLRNGYGYRDTVQDIQGVIHLNPEGARERLSFMLSAQASNGGGLPLVKFTHNPGHEDTPDQESYRRETGHPAWRADDAMWLFPTVYKYICETGNMDYLNEIIPYADSGCGTVYAHLKAAIGFSHERLGPHGMPAGLYADWNDCLRLGAGGESSFVAMQYLYALKLMKKFAELMDDTEYTAFLEEEKNRISDIIDKYCFKEDRFIRGYTESGAAIGAPGDNEAAFWLNPQSWAVISGAADKKQAEKIMDGVSERLNTPYGAVLMMPPFKENAFDGALAVIYNQGMKENSGIFSQSQGWLVLAEAILGHGNRAFEYYIENCPAAQNNIAETRKLEPYVYGQFTEGSLSPHAGRSHVHWLTGTASTMMVGSVEGILGIRPDIYGLRLEPAIPSEWDKLEIYKLFRGKKLSIKILNPQNKESGFTSMKVNGKSYSEPYIPEEDLTEETEIEFIM